MLTHEIKELHVNAWNWTAVVATKEIFGLYERSHSMARKGLDGL